MTHLTYLGFVLKSVPALLLKTATDDEVCLADRDFVMYTVDDDAALQACLADTAVDSAIFLVDVIHQ